MRLRAGAFRRLLLSVEVTALGLVALTRARTQGDCAEQVCAPQMIQSAWEPPCSSSAQLRPVAGNSALKLPAFPAPTDRFYSPAAAL